MALTRNYLKSMGLTGEKVSAIVENHGETVEALKQERDAYKTAAAEADELKKQLNAANEKMGKAEDAAKIKADFEA